MGHELFYHPGDNHIGSVSLRRWEEVSKLLPLLVEFDVTGLATIDGTLHVDILFVTTDESTYDLLTFSGFGGNLTVEFSGLVFAIYEILPTSLRVTLNPNP